MLKHLHLFKTLFLLLAVIVGGNVVTASGADVTTTYTFTSASWEAATGNWSGTDSGAQFNKSVTPKGVQITEAKNGVVVTSPKSFSNVKEVIVTYSSSSKGVGSIEVSVGSTSLGSKNISKSQTETELSYTASNLTGNVSFTVTCSKNSFAINSIKIVEAGTSVKAPVISPADGTDIYGIQSVTITQTDGKEIHYTTDGSNPSLSSAEYTGPFNVVASASTGTVTVKAIAADGSDTSSIVEATYTDPSIQPLNVAFTFNNALFGTSYSGSVNKATIEAAGGKVTGTVKNVQVEYALGTGSNFYLKDSEIRVYEGNTLTFTAPTGYNITKIVFTGGTLQYNGSALSDKTWEGEENSVVFTATSSTTVNTAAVTLERALPLVATLGDLNVTALKKDDTGTFSTTVTPAAGLSASDYTLGWAATPAGLIDAANGAYTASTRGAYKVTATATSNNQAYKTASKEYDVTVTEKVVVSAEDKIIAIGDDPVAIGATATDGYAGTLSYTSTNTAVATVDASGNITAVAKGTTTITISSPADASHYFTAGDDVVINVSVKGLAGLEYATTSYKVAYGASFPTPTLINPHNLPVTYAKTGDNVATVDPSTGAVTILTGTKGTARITASTVGDAEYAPGSAYYDIKVYDPEAGDGTLAKPFTVEEANEWIAENVASGNTTSETYYVRGIVSSLSASGKKLSDGTQYFFISDDGTETDELGVYYAKYLEKAAFSTTTWVMPGDEVVVCGPLQNYDGDKPYYVETGDDTFVQSITRKTFADGTLPVNETFASSFGTFTTDGTAVEKSSTSSAVWAIDTSKGYAKATSYISSSNLDAESMLISQMIDATAVSNIQLTFDQCVNKYFGKAGTSTTNANIANEAMVYAKKEGEATWTKLTISSYPAITSGNWSSFETATINLSAYVGYKFQIAFVYRGTSTTAGTWEIKNVVISPTSETVAISAAGLATYASDYALDYTDVEDIEAYIAKEEGSTVKLYQVNKVPAGTGVLLRSTNGGTEFVVPVATTTDDVTGNKFVRGAGETVASEEGGNYNYILNKIGGQLGFYKANDQMVAKNRAYLQTSVASARIALDFDDETTGIKSMDNGQWTMDNVYDMQGRKVVAPQKGLYIINGRKVVIK